MSIFFAEWLKIKRSPIKWIPIIAPVFISGFLVWYFSIKVATGEFQFPIYQGFFEVWSIIIVPIGVGLLSGLMIHQEEITGGFNGLLGSKASRANLYLGKLLMLILLTTISNIIAIATLYLGLRYVAAISISFPIFTLAAMVVQLSMIPLLAFHLWISFAWGMGASIGIGALGLLVSALMATSLGDMIWHFVPWGWSVRLPLLPGVYLSTEGASIVVFDELLKGTVPSFIFLLVMVIGGIRWFHRWDGLKVYD